MRIDIPVEIKSTDVHEKQVVTKTGKQFRFREQFGYLDIGKPYPVEIRISIGDAAAPYIPGKYMVDPGCLYVDRFGQLALGRIKLIGMAEKPE